MTKQIINIGTADKGNGDPLRTAFTKVNENFDELYIALGLNADVNLNLGAFEFAGSVLSTTDSSAIVIDQAVTVSSNLTVGGDVLPSVANGGDLGSAARPWKSLYISNNTIYIGGTAVGIDSQGNLLVGGQSIADVGTAAWNSITGKPTFATVATTGAYADLTGKPTIPTLVSQLANDSGFLTSVGNISNIQSESDVNIEINLTDSTTRIWRFGEDGDLTFPDATVQTTAWTGSVSSLVNGAKTVTLNTGGALTANLGSALGVQTSQTVTNNNIITADFDFFPSPGYVASVNSFIPVWSQRNAQQIEVNLFVYGGTPTYTMLTSLPLGTEVIVTYSQMGPQTFTTVLSQQFTDQGQVDENDNVRLSGRIDGTLPVGAVTIISINFTHYSTQSNAWTFGHNGRITLPNGAVLKDTASNAVAFGTYAGLTSQGGGAVAVGANAGVTSQGISAVAVGENAGYTSQGTRAVAIGWGAGSDTQGIAAVAIGPGAGQNSQGTYAVVVGAFAGYANQGANAVAVGYYAGYSNQAANSIIINATGVELNQTVANTFTVAPVRNASGTSGVLQYNSSTKEVTYSSDITSEGNINIEINLTDSTTRIWQFGEDGSLTFPDGTSQSTAGGGGGTLDSVTDSGSTTTNGITVGSVTLTNGAVLKDTAGEAVAFGQNAGLTTQGTSAVAIGAYAGLTSQGASAVAVGYYAGYTNQGVSAVAVGLNAGLINQGNAAVAVGPAAGNTSQGLHAVAIGEQSGLNLQGNSAVAVGSQAGYTGQGTYSVAVGYAAGQTSQAANTIIINATGSALNQTTANTFTVKPVRQGDTANSMYYNSSTGEITYAGAFSFSVAADDSTQRAISNNESIKFIGAGGVTTASDAEGNITITGSGGGPYFVLTGSTSVYVNQVVSYTINDYDSFTTYSVAVTSGTATIAGQTITFTAPAGATSVTLTISNGTVSRTATITVLASGVQTPVVTTPASSPYSYYVGTIVGNSYTFATGAFVALGVSDTHLNSDWQLASDSGFSTIVQSSMASTNNKTTWSQTLSSTGTFYLRVRHRGTANGASAYSTTVIMTVLAATVQTPTISSPASGTTNYNSPNITFASSAFTYLGTYDAHASSDWQLSTDSAFGTTVQTSMASASNLTSWTVSGLSAGTTYYARVRYTGSTNGTSSYSAVWNITTINTFSAVIATPTATPAIGASFEGGYYAGKIWNEVVQSTTSFALGTGQKTFVVPDMTSVPLVYVGQTLEVRSRAHPGCKMLGTVAGAGSTNLIVNVSSIATESPITITTGMYTLGASGDGTTATLTFDAQVPPFAVGDIITVAGITGGASGYNQVGATVISCNFNSLTYANATIEDYTSGGTISLTATTFSDWSIMAQYRIIVAPKATGDTGVAGPLAWKNSSSQGPTNSATLSEGRKSTLAMINAGNSTVYPAAWFCYNLNIAGRTDWYLPARDELALAFRSFRPKELVGIDGAPNAITGDNAAPRAVGFAFDYKTFGSPGDMSDGHGVNVNSIPPTTAYTPTVPDQTSIAAFQLYGAEAFDIALYWTSSDYAIDGGGVINYSNAWVLSVNEGIQAYVNKEYNYSSQARAVRRSII